jgi:hypothetical protein
MKALQALGGGEIPYHPMHDYWLRMVAGGFTLIGIWFLVLAIHTRRLAAAIPFWGGLMIVEAVVLLIHGLRLSLPPFPFYGDVAACLLGGVGILLTAKRVQERGRSAASAAL